MTDTSLKLKLADAVKQAMRARDSARLGTLRLVQAAIKQREIDERRELNDTEVTAILERQVKQRRESAAAYEQAGRAESAAQELAEIDVLQEFLPQQADAAEVEAAINEVVQELAAEGVSGPAAMGQGMARIKPRLAGRADMGQVSKQLAAKLKG